MVTTYLDGGEKYLCEKNEPDEIIQRIYNNIVVNVQWSACHDPTKEQSAIFYSYVFKYLN